MLSILSLMTPDGVLREVLRHESRPEARLQAPSHAPCGRWLLVNAGGALYRVPLEAPRLEPIPSDVALRCNNDHGFSGDGRILFGSHHEGQGAQIYAMPMAGGAVERISSQPPSWWHGLSPDGASMVYAAVRPGATELDIYRRALAGGTEIRLTQGEGHNDGPEFSADGRQIYWNSDRGGHAQIWAMAADGSGQRRLFADDWVNWFPHPSPCGQWLVWLAYPPGTLGHPFDLPVRLLLSDAQGRGARVMAEFTGGQGTINVPPWAPDSRAFAFISYEP